MPDITPDQFIVEGMPIGLGGDQVPIFWEMASTATKNALLAALIEGQFDRLEISHILKINRTAGRCEDVTEEFARELSAMSYRLDYELCEQTRYFITSNGFPAFEVRRAA